MGALLGMPGLHRYLWVRSNAWISDFPSSTQHDRVLRWRQVQPDHVDHLRLQLGVGGKRDTSPPATAGSRTPFTPGQPWNGRHPASSQQPARPVRHPQTLRRRGQGRGQDRRPVDLAWPARPPHISEPRHMPSSAYRGRHRFTVGRDTPTPTAITQFASPSAASCQVQAPLVEIAHPRALVPIRASSSLPASPALAPGQEPRIDSG